MVITVENIMYVQKHYAEKGIRWISLGYSIVLELQVQHHIQGSVLFDFRSYVKKIEFLPS